MTATFYRRVIKIKGTDSPNVVRGFEQLSAGLTPTDEVVLPGVLGWAEYQKRLATWDKVRVCVGLEGEFYEGAEVLLFPPEWLNRAAHLAAGRLVGRHGRPPEQAKRRAEGVGIDPAEGGDKTAMTAVDRWGVIEQRSRKTPDTNAVYGEAMEFVREWGCDPGRVMIDRGGGGKQLADRLRATRGFERVQTVSFGEPISVDLKRHRTLFEERVEALEDRWAYKNVRAEMYGDSRQLLDPALDGSFGIPDGYEELRRQLAPLPTLYDAEGRIYLPPKNKPTPTYTGVTLTELLGCSPDEADSYVLAVRGMIKRPPRPTAGALK